MLNAVSFLLSGTMWFNIILPMLHNKPFQFINTLKLIKGKVYIHEKKLDKKIIIKQVFMLCQSIYFYFGANHI